MNRAQADRGARSTVNARELGARGPDADVLLPRPQEVLAYFPNCVRAAEALPCTRAGDKTETLLATHARHENGMVIVLPGAVVNEKEIGTRCPQV